MSELFRLDGRVSRATYVRVGVVLMALKYGVEAITVMIFCDQPYWPSDFLNPLLESRSSIAECGPSWFGMAWLLWTIPFVWIAVAMSVRRAIDAGASPWIFMLMLVPVINLMAMLYLAWKPSVEEMELSDQVSQDRAVPWQTPQVEGTPPRDEDRGGGVTAAILGIGVGAGYALIVTVLSVYLAESYGSALFFGTPVVAGAASAYFLNRHRRHSIGMTLGHGTVMIMACCAGFMLFALEGAICIVMALPIMVPLALFGALLGRAVALYGAAKNTHHDPGFAACLIGLPIITFAEPYVVHVPTYEVVSTVEIEAPPQDVWDAVVAFPDIEAEAPWYFRLGIAMPIRAQIQGQGVGAIRRCEFTTGVFVEPITVWDEPNRLAFDVTEQPEPMFELTPYKHIHPPHLHGAFRSERGEFRLAALPDGKTRLEGSTWYTLRIFPNAYWCNWTHWIVHRIHVRVLDHIRIVAEG